MVIFFVGMHNKPGMKPLDSRTKTGKFVDDVADQLPCKFMKTNLVEVDHFPTNDEAQEAAILWWEQYSPPKGSVIVLLGAWTHEHFLANGHKVLKMPHPSSIWSNEKRDAAKQRFVIKILDSLK